MKLFFVVLDYDDMSGHLSNSDALENHPQIVKYFKKNKAIQISANCFLLKSKFKVEEIVSSLTPFLDRPEWIYVFDISVNDWQAVSNTKILKAIEKSVTINLFQ